MPRRRRAQPASEDQWKQAVEIAWDVTEDKPCIQVVGWKHDDVTATIFVRVVEDAVQFTLWQLLERVLQEDCRRNHRPAWVTTAELYRLGAIWLLDPKSADRPQNQPVWQRLEGDDPKCQLGERNYEFGMTLRLHCLPARFPIDQWDVANSIEWEDLDLGLTILNKPTGVPSHATVENGRENALSTYRRYRPQVDYATLPQRLDTETSGLLLVATQKRFAAYASQLLHQKTQQAGDGTSGCVKKMYRSLVCFGSLEDWNNLKKLQTAQSLVTHYVDAGSPAPKRFVKEVPTSPGAPTQKWLQCHLRIVNLESAVPISTQQLVQALWTEGYKPQSVQWVAQVEVDLLTGRSHQIRGQMAMLGAPIVGDPLYGGTSRAVCAAEQRSVHRMALQCCHMSMPRPTTSGGKLRVASDSDRISVELKRGWWTEFLGDPIDP